MEIKIGRYKHFKGHEIKVICVAKHTETEEDMVVYEHLGHNEKSKMWVRPAKMFLEQVNREGYKGPRFAWLGE